MEYASLIPSASHYDRILYRRINIQFDFRLTVVHRNGGPTRQGKVQLTGFVKHPLSFVPVVGKVLVVKDRHRAFALLKNPDNLIVDPPARQEPVPLEILWVITVFRHNDNPIHSKFFSPQRNSFADGLKDGNAFGICYLLTE